MTTFLRRLLAVIRYAGIFTVELIKANIEVAIAVLKPRLDVRPSILAIPNDCRSEGEVTMLASSITLTPGTLVVEVSPDHHTLYVHALSAEDPKAVEKSIRDRLEEPIRRIFE